jgi:hypothetical protein
LSEELDIQEGTNPQNRDDNSNVNSSSSESTEAKRLAADNQQQSIKNMETHADHLHKAPGHGWKHYLFEFFMLFLAVTAGYFVENQREHYLEHQREKVFMESMLEDVIKDTIMLTRTEKNARRAVANIDTIVDILENLKLDDSSLVVLYRANLGALSFIGPSFTDRTSSQLKNSGGMRLIRNRQVTDSIINYWSQSDIAIQQNERIEGYKEKARDQSYRIIIQKYYVNSEIGTVQVNNPHPKLMTENIAQLTEWANRLSHIRAMARLYIPSISTQKKKAASLIEIIKKEYHLK